MIGSNKHLIDAAQQSKQYDVIRNTVKNSDNQNVLTTKSLLDVFEYADKSKIKVNPNTL